MWGADYPHLEGAAPVHRETLRYIFGGMPEEDVRRMLGANAIGLWGFDADLLQAVADRVGPTVADLATPLELADIEDTFSWSLARPVPLAAAGLPKVDLSLSILSPFGPPRRCCRNRSGGTGAASLTNGTTGEQVAHTTRCRPRRRP